MTEGLHGVIYVLILVFGAGMLAGKAASKLRLPVVALFLAAGMLAGPGLGLLHVESGTMTNQLILTLGSAIILFDGGRNIRLSNGFMATFTAGLIWGNAGTFKLDMSDELEEIGHFTENMTVLMRMLIFILLGSQVPFGDMLKHLGPGLAVVAIFMLVGRPLTVFLCAAPDRRAKWSLKDLFFMCWVRETGVIPAALSGMIAGMAGVAHKDVLASVTFLTVLL